MTDSSKPTDRGDQTRSALLQAAMDEFSDSGYHAASNREIAQQAQANQALIGYHFGGKQGLYLAVFQFISEQIQKHTGSVIAQMEAHLSRLPDGQAMSAEAREECIALVLGLVERMAKLFVSPLFKPAAQLILREQQKPTQAFDILYESFMRRSLRVVTDLIQRIRPGDSHEDASLLVITILGQVLVFRAARSTVLRHLDWEDIGPDQFEAINRRVKANVRAILSSGDEK